MARIITRRLDVFAILAVTSNDNGVPHFRATLLNIVWSLGRSARVVVTFGESDVSLFGITN
jgi:hypothetical protein